LSERSWSPLGSKEDVTWISLLTIVALVGLYLRVDGIQSSLWLDEFGTLWATEGTLRLTIKRVLSFHGQTPFYYVIAWSSLRICGETEVCLRAPSLLVGVGVWIAIFLTAREFLGKTASRYAFMLVAFDPTLISMSANARPYNLALFFLAIAVLGLLRACQRGGTHGRALWILGGVGTAWAHYLMFPIIVSFILAYLLLPTCRSAYGRQAFQRDLLIQFGFILPALPQLFDLWRRRTSLDWLSAPHHFAPFVLVFPYLAALGLGLMAGRWKTVIPAEPRKLLLASLAFSLIIFEGLFLAGINLLFLRYIQGILIPAILLSAWALASIKGPALRIAQAWAFLTLGGLLLLGNSATGSFSRVGLQGWREAVAELRLELGDSSSVPVFFRSGFVEEDVLPLGSTNSATRAPLRSPGKRKPKWNIQPLTYRWDSDHRSLYFSRRIEPVIEGSTRFYLLSLGDYSTRFANWVEQTWPDQFQIAEEEFKGVHLIRFDSQTVSRDGKVRPDV